MTQQPQTLTDTRASIAKMRVVYQHQGCGKGGDRFKPFLFNEEGIHYVSFPIEIDQVELKETGFCYTLYGIFSLRALEAPWWAGCTRISLESKIKSAREHGYAVLAFALDLTAPAAAILGLSLPFTQDELKLAYRTLAKTHHPDIGGNREKFLEIQSAYEILSEQGEMF